MQELIIGREVEEPPMRVDRRPSKQARYAAALLSDDRSSFNPINP